MTIAENVRYNTIAAFLNKQNRKDKNMQKDNMITDLTQGNLKRQIITFAVPFMLANALQTLYTLVDLIIVGQFVGSVGLSAISISGQITVLIMTVGNGLSNGAQIYISQLVGQKDSEGVSKTIGSTLTTVLLTGIIIGLAGIALAKPILTIINTPEESFKQATEYFMICCIGTVFVFGYNAVCSVLRGMGESKKPMLFIAVASVTNIVLDLLFVAVFKMESAGAAWATIISQAVSFIFALTFLYRRKEAFGFDFKMKSFAIDMKKFKVIIKLGIPLAAMQIFINISMIFCNSYINAYGVAASAVAGVGNKLYSLMGVVTGSFIATVATFVGQNMGAGNYDRIKKTVWYSWGFCTAFFVIVAFFALVFPTQIFRLFTSDAEVLEMAPRYLRISVWLYLSFAWMGPTLGLINGVGFTTLNLIIGILDSVVARIFLSLYLGITLNMGLWGFFWGSALAGFVSVILGAIYFWSGKWKSRSVLKS